VDDRVSAGDPTRRGVLTAAAAFSLALLRPGRSAARSRWWPDHAGAAVSLSYDDGLDSQLDNVLPALASRNLRASFYLTEENMASRLDRWVEAARAGHEIADHTVTHPCALRRYSSRRFADEEIRPMERFLDEHFGAGPRTFAYPCGFTRLGSGPPLRRARRYAAALGESFLAARTVEGPPNDPDRALRAPMRLGAFEPTYEQDDPSAAVAYLERTLARGAWAILVFHEVLPVRGGEGDTSIRTHEAILDWITRRPFWVAPVREVYARLAAVRAGVQ
jgi:peptidoglycan/xylan/chitin deacetylase (PgdA/CDA1 family)